MPVVNVPLEFPLDIIAGLASGKYERVGGIIRMAQNKQVVSWLLEGGDISSNSDLASGALKALLQASTGNVAAVAAGAANAAITGHSHQQILREMLRLSNLMQFAGGIGVLNVGISVLSLVVLSKQMRDLSNEIKNLHALVAKEFAKFQQVNLDTAIVTAEGALSSPPGVHKDMEIVLAKNQLYSARQHIFYDIDPAAYSSAITVENNQFLQTNLLLALHVDTLRIRCLLEQDRDGGGLQPAKDYLSICLKQYLELTRLLVNRWLGYRRAVFFHKKTVSELDLYRYIAIEQWLKNKDNVLLELILSNRPDFWDMDVVSDMQVSDGKLAFLKLKPAKGDDGDGKIPVHLAALTQSEILIENYQRLQGLEAEIKAIERLGLSHFQWKTEVDLALENAEVNLAEHNDFVLLFDDEYLESLNRFSQDTG